MTKIFVDAADLDEVVRLIKKNYISGITTNPTLMRKSGVSNYEIFAKAVINSTSLPISLEVFSDELDEMYEQAEKELERIREMMSNTYEIPPLDMIG